jgi:arylsulfatase A-like enzyme
LRFSYPKKHKKVSPSIYLFVFHLTAQTMRNYYFLAFAFLFTTCTEKEALDTPTTPNFIVFIADDVSWDDFGCYGNAAVKTPNIDAQAEAGIRFDNAFLTASSCSPSRVSILSGRYPHNTGAAELHMPLPEGVPTIGGQLQQAGYFVGASGKWHMGEAAKADFDVVLDQNIGWGGEDRWSELVDSIPSNQPYFLWLAAIDAHRGWADNAFDGSTELDAIDIPPYMRQDSSTRADFGKYYDEITRFDHYIGEVLAQLEAQQQLDNTIVIIMADNGRPFPRDKTRLYDSGIQTPFIVNWIRQDDKPTGTTSDALISVVDLAPTLSNLANAKTPDSYQGRSFAHLLQEPNNDHRSYVFAEHNWHDYAAHGRMVRSKDYLYIENNLPNRQMSSAADVHSGDAFQSLVAAYRADSLTAAQQDNFIMPRSTIEFYDCQNDPMQLNNLADDPSYQPQLQQLQQVLATWQQQTADTFPDSLTQDRYDFFTAQGTEPDRQFSDIDRGDVGAYELGAKQVGEVLAGFEE